MAKKKKVTPVVILRDKEIQELKDHHQKLIEIKNDFEIIIEDLDDEIEKVIEFVKECLNK